MNFFYALTPPDCLHGQHVYLDGDFLGMLFSDGQIFQKCISILSKSPLLIDPLVEIEFLRDIFLPEQFKIKNAFISQPIFLPLARSQEIFLKILENVLVLSKIYAHQNKSKGVSFVDLFLAATLMKQPQSLLITGNKKHFPSTLFDTLGVINIQQGDDLFKAFFIVKFNETAFQQASLKLKRVSNPI
ncbi:MAG: hypothetical protein Q8R11_02635 [bacterium]|nr:hypothetical protein [bacterium]